MALSVVAVQNCAGPDISANLARLDDLIAPIRSADLVALPEFFALRGSHADYRAKAQPLDGEILQWAAQCARKKKAWLLAGSMPERDGGRLFNTSVLFNREGERAAVYRKIHLFEALLDDGTTLREAETFERGLEPVSADMEGWVAGLSICYDLRFPELYRRYAGAHLLLAPSAWVRRTFANAVRSTGGEHWEILVRARAVENQCFVVAPGHCGVNPASGVRSHGHSLIAGPCGEILAEAGDDETVLTAQLDPGLIDLARQRIPALKHRVL